MLHLFGIAAGACWFAVAAAFAYHRWRTEMRLTDGLIAVGVFVFAATCLWEDGPFWIPAWNFALKVFAIGMAMVGGIAENCSDHRRPTRLVWFLVAVSSLTGFLSVVLLFRRPRSGAVEIRKNQALFVDGDIRHVRLVVPRIRKKSIPLLIAFHGVGDSPDSMAAYSGLDELAAPHGFLLVYPAARGTTWATAEPDLENLDAKPDVRFFDELVRYLVRNHDVDRRRIYAVGMSNGAVFAQLLAIARETDLAGIAAHSGPCPVLLDAVGRDAPDRKRKAPGGKIRHAGGRPERPPILLIVGDGDPAAAAMRSDAVAYRARSHLVEFILVPDLGHAWSSKHNEAIWRFLSRNVLDDAP